MRDMQMDKTELGCLRAIVLFNPGTALLPPVWPRALVFLAALPHALTSGPSVPIAIDSSLVPPLVWRLNQEAQVGTVYNHLALVGSAVHRGLPSQ